MQESSSGVSKSSLNPRDRLKKKMQILLNKQCKLKLLNKFALKLFEEPLFGLFVDKADKMAEIEKNERQIQQQQERDDEMRETILRLRRR